MNKYVLPSAAALLILVIALSSFMPAAAVTRRLVGPALVVRTIAEDDQLRQTGVMSILAAAKGSGSVYLDFMAQYKIIISLDGLLVSNAGITFYCNVAEKDKVSYPSATTTIGKSVIPPRQTSRENLRTVIEDVADKFLCKIRWKPGGLSVGVLDLYYIGPQDAAYIADHLVVVHVAYTVGRQTFYGVDLQDVCVLGWSMDTTTTFTKTWGDLHYSSADPLKGWSGCEELALFQRSFFPGVTPTHE